MEFSFNVNQLLKEEITKIDSALQPCRQNCNDRYGFRHLQSILYEIVDRIGEASAKAQGLHASITTGKKLELTEHRLYLMKDEAAYGGKGAIVGILKVGTKKLFVYDQSKNQHELDPLCVLDFYVHESRQRMGCGRKLFDFMLRSEGISAQHLAIDRPSQKFSSFLAKHYNLRGTIPQVNNFVIFDGFFSSRRDLGNIRNRRRGLGYNDERPPMNPLRPGSGRQRKDRNNGHLRTPPPGNHVNNLAGLRSPESSYHIQDVKSNLPPVAVNAKPQHDSNMGAAEMNYSRHGPSPPSSQTRIRNSSPMGYLNAPAASPSSVNFKMMNGLASPHMYYNTGMSPGGGLNHVELLSSKYPQQRSAQNRDTPPTPVRGPGSCPNFGNRMAGADMSGSSLNQASNGRATPPVLDPRLPMPQTQSIPLPVISTNQQSPAHPSYSGEVTAHRPPSGKRPTPYASNRDPSNPPLLPRGGPPQNYSQFLNMHQSYQDKGGHLKTSEKTDQCRVPEVVPPKVSPLSGPVASQLSRNTSWTVTGVLRDQRINGAVSSRHYGSTRLW